MAKKANYSADVIQHEKHKKVTSIGRSARCTPKNKNKRAQWKRYRGQGNQMYLCLCNGVNERTVRDLIRKDKLRTAKQVYKVIGPLQCGKCTSYINKYIDKDKEGLL